MVSPTPPSHTTETLAADTVEMLSRRVTFSLIFGGSEFRHRQVLKLIAVDHTLMRYRASLDFTIPSIPSNRISVLSHVFVPVAIVPKRVLGDIDLRDEGNRSLPALNREDESELTRHFIVLFWLTNYVDPRTMQLNPAATEDDLPREALQLLVKIIESDPAIASVYVNRFEHGWEDSWSKTLRDGARETLLSLVKLLADQAMTYAMLQDAQLGTRRIVKLSYNDRFPSASRKGWPRSLLRLFGLSPIPIYVHIPSAVNVASFHIEMAAPVGFAFLDGYVTAPDDRRVLPGSVPPLGATYAHFYLPKENRVKDLQAELFLLPERDGWIRTASLAAWFVAAAIAFFAVFNARLRELHNATPAASALLAAGAIGTAYLARPLEHRLTSRLLRGARGLILLSGIVATVSIGIVLLTGEDSSLSSQPSPPQVWALTDWRWLSTVLALLAAVGLWPGSSVTWVVEWFRRYRHRIYRRLTTWSDRIGNYLRSHGERRARS